VLARMFRQARLWAASWNLNPLWDGLRPRQLRLATCPMAALACGHVVL